MANIVINGKTINVPYGSNVRIINDTIIINDIPSDEKLTQNVTIQVNGSIAGFSINVNQGNVTVHGDVNGKINCGLSATVSGNVKGDIDAGGSVTCGDVDGDIDTGGSVKCGNVRGDIDAGGSVKHG